METFFWNMLGWCPRVKSIYCSVSDLPTFEPAIIVYSACATFLKEDKASIAATFMDSNTAKKLICADYSSGNTFNWVHELQSDPVSYKGFSVQMEGGTTGLHAFVFNKHSDPYLPLQLSDCPLEKLLDFKDVDLTVKQKLYLLEEARDFAQSLVTQSASGCSLVYAQALKAKAKAVLNDAVLKLDSAVSKLEDYIRDRKIMEIELLGPESSPNWDRLFYYRHCDISGMKYVFTIDFMNAHVSAGPHGYHCITYQNTLFLQVFSNS